MISLLVALLLARAIQGMEPGATTTFAVSEADGRLTIRNCVGCQPIEGGEVSPENAAVVLLVNEYGEDCSIQLTSYPPQCGTRVERNAHYFAHSAHALAWLGSHDIKVADVIGLFSIHKIPLAVREEDESIPQPPLTRVKRTWRVGE